MYAPATYVCKIFPIEQVWIEYECFDRGSTFLANDFSTDGDPKLLPNTTERSLYTSATRLFVESSLICSQIILLGGEASTKARGRWTRSLIHVRRYLHRGTRQTSKDIIAMAIVGGERFEEHRDSYSWEFTLSIVNVFDSWLLLG